ncbi:unnamed protein product [Symbiodinium microadriaticum]|nr:unnamed protein product [Symbiodinium sp. KB8]CAE7706304.1 unnamed protein product [Symbiodinium microadriaticum]
MGSAASLTRDSLQESRCILPSANSPDLVQEPEQQTGLARALTIEPEDQSPGDDIDCMLSWRSWGPGNSTPFLRRRGVRHHEMYMALLNAFQQEVEMSPDSLELSVAAHRGEPGKAIA